MDASLVTTGVIAATSVFVALATVAVGLRIYARNIMSARMGADDYFIIAALVFCYGELIITIITGAHGGVNTIRISPFASGTWFVKMLWVEPFLVSPALALVKISILLFYKRIFDVVKRLHIACNIMITIIILWAVAILIVQFTMARPISGVWDLTGNFLVINYDAASLSFAGISIGLDLATLCLPIPVIYKLQMKAKQKFFVAGIFWLGLFCVIAGSLRFYYGEQELNESFNSLNDNRYKLVTKVYTWDRIEPCASIICACLPTFGPLVRSSRVLESLIQSAASFLSLRSSPKNTEQSGDQFNQDGSKHRFPWARLNDDKGVVITEVKNNWIELESQTRLNSQPDKVHITSEWEIGRGSEVSREAREL